MPRPGDRVSQLEWRNLSLDDFFSEGEFAEAIFAARWRIIRVFTDVRVGQGRSATPGSIAGLDDQLTSLATYLHRHIGERARDKIYSSLDLPRKYRHYSGKEKERLADCVRYELFVRLLTLMKEMNSIWRMDGEWWVPQSVMDEYLLLFKGAKESYRNQRSFHGRPNRDRQRLRGLGYAPGTSTGA
jgi:hypothetical protein